MTVENAVSAEEKNADNMTRMIDAVICLTPVETYEIYTPKAYDVKNYYEYEVSLKFFPDVEIILENGAEMEWRKVWEKGKFMRKK